MSGRDEVGGEAADLTRLSALAGVRVGDEGLQLSDAAVFQLFDDVPVAISATAGPSHRIVYANRFYRRMLIAPDTPLIGRELREVFGSNYRPELFELRDRVLREGRPVKVGAEPIRRPAGEPKLFWDILYFPLLDETGSAAGVLGFAIDVTNEVTARIEAEQRAEHANARAEEASLARARLALAVEATDLGIWEWDVETGAVEWSARQKAIWGLPPDVEITYDMWRESIHPDDREAVLGRIGRTLDPASGGDQRLTHRIVRPDGALRWIASHGRMIYHEDTGRPLRMIGTVSDITDREAADAALKLALESKDILLREVNHRIKNSLQLVSSLLALQSGRTGNEEVRALVQEAQLRVKAVAAVHDRLYRSEDISSVELGSFIDILCRGVEGSFAKGDAAVAIEVDTVPVTVGNDRAVPIGLILNELLTNALKYAYPQGGGMIRVGLTADEDGLCVLTVADDGVGVPADFEHRSASSLGYRIINGLARQLDAEIEIAPGSPGTAISVRFAQEGP